NAKRLVNNTVFFFISFFRTNYRLVTKTPIVHSAFIDQQPYINRQAKSLYTNGFVHKKVWGLACIGGNQAF
ncbi:hypothetical protein AM232_26155, partial [Bacillus sp. FJAT-21352]